MSDINFPRVATILRQDNGTFVVSGIAERSAPADFDKRQLARMRAGQFYEQVVGGDVKIGMLRQPDESFAWPVGHPNETAAVRQQREAKRSAA